MNRFLLRHRLAALLAALATALAFAVAPTARADTMRDNVSEDQLTPYRAMAPQFADASSLGPEWRVLQDLAGLTCIEDLEGGMGAMGVHYVNLTRAFDGVIDSAQPDIVVYEPRPDGQLHLVALDYFILADQVTTSPELFPGHPFGYWPAPNRFGLPAFYTQHVWIGKGNPMGNLAMWNPNVHCDSPSTAAR